MFDHRHYVPVLRWKRGEWRALKRVGEADRDLITPLLEFTPTDLGANGVDERLEEHAATMADCWGPRFALIDTALVPSSIQGARGRHPLLVFAEHAHSNQLGAVPVTGLDRDAGSRTAAREAARRLGTGAAIRLRRPDFIRPDLGGQVADLCEFLGLVPEQLDLILDYGRSDSSAPAFGTVLSRIPRLREWRTLTAISGAFPKDLSSFSVGEHDYPRADWIWWRDQVRPPHRLPRVPAYGDYTTQHAVFSEPPARANFSASIRYAAENHWVVMRGEGVFKDDGPGFAQWPANAQLLCDREEFCGAEFSAGDGYIFDTGQQIEKTGNAETWLAAAVNHHLVFTARQIATLFGP